MNKKQKYYFIIFIATILLSVLVYHFTKNQKQSKITWKKSGQVYDFYFRGVVKSKDLENTWTTRTIDIRAKLNFKVYDIKENIIYTVFQFNDVQVKIYRRRNRILENLFSKLFFVQMNHSGKFLRFIFHNKIAKEDENVIKDVVQSLQVIIKGSSFNYSTEEKDRNGGFIANYTQTANKLIKNKQRYYAVNKNNFDKIKIVRSKSIVEIENNMNWVKNNKHTELLVFSNSGNIEMKVFNKINLKKIDIDVNTKLAIWKNNIDYQKIRNDWLTGIKNKISIIKKIKRKELQNKFANRTFEQVVDFLFFKNKKNKVEIMKSLLEYLELYPKSSTKFLEYLKKKKLTKLQRITLVHALERNGSADSQKSLIEIMNSGQFKEESRLQAAISFNSIQEPTRKSIYALWNLYQKRNNKLNQTISNSVILSLGTVSETLENNFTENRNMSGLIKDKIKNELEKVKDISDIDKINALLYAAGNTSDTEFIGTISEFIENNDQRVRSVAINSLRTMNDDRVETIFKERLDNEKNINVKGSIVKTMYKRPGSQEMVDKIIERLPHEENDIVKGQMYRYLLKNRNYVNVKSFLRERNKIESHREYKQMIQKALYSNK